MSEGSKNKRYRAPVVKPREDYVALGWPKTCICGRATRPAHTKAADWPGTIASENQDGECPKCALGARYTDRSKGNGRVLRAKILRTPEEEAQMIKQARADLEALWADRRRRGIDPDGVFFEGEKPIHHTPASFNDGTVDRPKVAREMGLCPNGHEYTHRDSLGHRRCATCLSDNGKALAVRRQAKLEAGEIARTENCPKGHPRERTPGKSRVHCRVCENEARRVARAAQRARQAAEGAPLGYCKRGHAYTGLTTLGARRCQHCETENKRVARRRLRAEQRAKDAEQTRSMYRQAS